MHCKPSVGTFILEWLTNRTPPQCIRDNIVSMALALNPHSNIVKEIPCVKYIQDLRSVLALLTNAWRENLLGVLSRSSRCTMMGPGIKERSS